MPERRGRVVGLYGIFMWLGITLGALAGTVAKDLSGFPAVWGLCVVVSVEATWADSVGTVRGDLAHRAVDLPGAKRLLGGVADLFAVLEQGVAVAAGPSPSSEYWRRFGPGTATGRS